MILPFLIAATEITTQVNTEMVTVNKNRVCSVLVNVPYASDNLTKKEWEQFKLCIRFFDVMNNVK